MNKPEFTIKTLFSNQHWIINKVTGKHIHTIPIYAVGTCEFICHHNYLIGKLPEEIDYTIKIVDIIYNYDAPEKELFVLTAKEYLDRGLYNASVLEYIAPALI